MNPNATSTSSKPDTTTESHPPLQKHTARLQPGQTEYKIHHNFGTEDVIVQTRIANRIREGGVAIADANTVRIFFGGVLNEPLDVVIIG
jgi:hypothetical protein